MSTPRVSSRRSRRTRGPNHLTVAQDLLTFSLGMALIIRQGWFVEPAQINIWAMVFGGTLINVPVAGQLLAARMGSPPSGPAGQDSSPSPTSSSDT